ncbi:hypothetical protein K488DRAFT_74620, partial [Vararia minispora EC-137]
MLPVLVRSGTVTGSFAGGRGLGWGEGNASGRGTSEVVQTAGDNVPPSATGKSAVWTGFEVPLSRPRTRDGRVHAKALAWRARGSRGRLLSRVAATTAHPGAARPLQATAPPTRALGDSICRRSHQEIAEAKEGKNGGPGQTYPNMIKRRGLALDPISMLDPFPALPLDLGEKAETQTAATIGNYVRDRRAAIQIRRRALSLDLIGAPAPFPLDLDESDACPHDHFLAHPSRASTGAWMPSGSPKKTDTQTAATAGNYPGGRSTFGGHSVNRAAMRHSVDPSGRRSGARDRRGCYPLLSRSIPVTPALFRLHPRRDVLETRKVKRGTDWSIVRAGMNVSPATRLFRRKGGRPDKRPDARLYVKKKSAGGRASSKTGQSNEGAGQRHKGRPYSIKSQEHREWLEARRPAYERSSGKGKKAAREFVTDTTTAFLDRFGWSYTHFKTQGCENREGDADEERDAIYKMARQVRSKPSTVGEEDLVTDCVTQKVYNFFHTAGSGSHASQVVSVRSLLQSLLGKTTPVRRPKLVNVFRRSPHYTSEMRAEFLAEWSVMDDDDDDDEDADADEDEVEEEEGDEDERLEDDNYGVSRATGTRKGRLRLAREEQFLSRKLLEVSTDVKTDLEKRAIAEYEEKVAQREAWLDQGPSTFEEAAEMMKTLTPVFEKLVGWLAEQGGYSACASGTYDLYDPEGHADVCARIFEHAMRGLRRRALTSEGSSPAPMELAGEGELEDLLGDRMSTTPAPVDSQDFSAMARQGLVVPERGEDEMSGDKSDWCWPGEVLGTVNEPDDKNTRTAFEPNAETDSNNAGKGEDKGEGNDADVYAEGGEDGLGCAGEDDCASANQDNRGDKDNSARVCEGDGDGAGEGEGAGAGEGEGAGAGEGEGAGADVGYGDAECGGENEWVGDLMTLEEQQYWDAVMWPDEGVLSPKEKWLREVSRPWVVTRTAGTKGKAPKSWIHKYVQVVAEVVRSTKEGPPGMEGTFAYPQKLMDAFDAAATLERFRGFEPAARDNGTAYLEELPYRLQPEYWKVWRKARFPATLPVAVEGAVEENYGLELIKYWLACQPDERLPQTRTGSLISLAPPNKRMDWGLLAARGPGGTFGF